MKNDSLLARFFQYIIPVPGVGGKCHQAILGKANLKVLAELDLHTIHHAIRDYCGAGSITISNREIEEARKESQNDCTNRENTLRVKCAKQEKTNPDSEKLKTILVQNTVVADCEMPIPDTVKESRGEQ